MTYKKQRRVVITGLGVVAANGTGKEAFWHATSKGVSGIKPVQRFSTAGLPIVVAGEATDFVVEDFIDRKLAKRTDRMTHFVFAAVQEALQDAGIELAEENPHRVGAVIANTVGGVEYVLEQIEALYVRGPRYMSAYTAIAWLQVANVGQVSLRYGIQGYCKTPVNDTVGGLDALGIAYGAIKHGAADIIIAGGCEALLHPCVLLVMAHSGQCATGDDPKAYRPFDRRAAGLLLAEGAGMCIVEEYEHARRRGAHIYGEIVGYGQTNDAHGLLKPSANGAQYARAIRLGIRGPARQCSAHDAGPQLCRRGRTGYDFRTTGTPERVYSTDDQLRRTRSALRAEHGTRRGASTYPACCADWRARQCRSERGAGNQRSIRKRRYD